MFYQTYDYLIDELDLIAERLSSDAKELGFDINFMDVNFDTSRSWSVYVDGSILDLNVNKFGAYRSYLGGGVCGPIESNGREEDGTLELARLFEEALANMEETLNGDYEDAPVWELPTGVLL